jgi:CHASE1-domain containing sensor protein
MKAQSNQALETEILALTTRIENEFPELYKLLGETPLFLSYTTGQITQAELKEYRDTLRSQLSTFETNEEHHGNL